MGRHAARSSPCPGHADESWQHLLVSFLYLAFYLTQCIALGILFFLRDLGILFVNNVWMFS